MNMIKKSNLVTAIFGFSLLIMVIISTFFIIISLKEINTNSKTMNYSSKVRVEVQRLVKLELAKRPSPQLELEINNIINGLIDSNVELGINITKNESYNKKIIVIKMYWNDFILSEIRKVRKNESNELIDNSEVFYSLIEEAVLDSQVYSRSNVEKIEIFTIIIFLLNFAIIINFFNYIRLKNVQIMGIAFIDDLTGEGNRNKFNHDATALLKRNRNYALIILDVDKIKILNDQLGFDKGDKLIKIIGKTLKNQCKKQECFARNNSDEFLLLLEYRSQKELRERIVDLYEQIKWEFSVQVSENYCIDLSSGAFIIESNKEKLSIIIDMARHAHAQCKKSEVGICFFDDKIRVKLLDDKTIENEMYEAIENEEFQIYLQPKYELKTEKICGAESLVRWKKLNNSVVFPDGFIPLFEANGFIKILDMYMLENTCKIIGGWIKKGYSPIPVSVNFSRKHFENDHFVEEITKIVDKYNIEHNLIEIEITENSMLDNGILLEILIKKLHEKGFLLSMDDFGSGFSSLGLLKNMSFDVIKMDRSFFVEYKDINKAKSVISNMIKMAKELNIKTVAEGVENVEQLEFLDEMGCDIVQGYYFSEPVLSTDFDRFIK